MGLALAWMAFKGAEQGDLYERMRLAPTGERGDFLDCNVAGRALADDWILITFKHMSHPLTSKQMLQSLSDACQIIVCRIEEHVNYSSLEAWENGARLWSIEHEGDREILDLKVEGHPPTAYAAFESAGRESQRVDGEVDHLFEVPLNLALSITGFRHDESIIGDFDLLQWQKPTKSKWHFW